MQLIPLLQELAGGANALDIRLKELSRQSRLTREMVQQSAEGWERENLIIDDCRDCRNDHVCRDEEQPSSGKQAYGSSSVRADLFPLKPFVQEKGVHGRGEKADTKRRPALPELVREELLHRFVTGE